MPSRPNWYSNEPSDSTPYRPRSVAGRRLPFRVPRGLRRLPNWLVWTLAFGAVLVVMRYGPEPIVDAMRPYVAAVFWAGLVFALFFLATLVVMSQIFPAELSTRVRVARTIGGVGFVLTVVSQAL